MFLVRLAVIAVGVIMLLPAEPRHDALAGSRSAPQNFCSRYPKTCDASGELWSAFKRKLSYGIKLARKEFATRSGSDSGRYGSSKLGGQFGEWRPPVINSHRSSHADNTLSGDERSTEWRRDRH